ncbi:hypothetical protein GBA63_07730 [Rubrobacter tropicus]|uniref:DUF2029 domain-containing protein n=1 Tax=Rubrobacter tropicus TaxID=2653851 RepID=A0A6G8Q7W7_9ACTN|nr:hypothetical protein [Rubrobacter tropicus]QIN82543.1 hypothetical protein GBA63_07730 [Rubrobacter tropicus]
MWAVVLLPLLLLAVGLAPGPRLGEEEAAGKAAAVEELSEYYAKPTVEAEALYDGDDDAWRVALVETVSGDEVAEFAVADDSGRVGGVEVSSKAEEIDYPTLTEAEAVRLAASDAEVRGELAEHGPYTTGARYEDGRWTVRFYVDETGMVGGRPTDQGKEVATVQIDDETWVIDSVQTGDQVGWLMARGISGAYGKQANYPWVWGPLALAFALAFVRTDKLFSLRNLDIVMLLGFLVSHSFFRQGIVLEAVVLWYPPLIYLLGRTLLMGFGIGERVEKTSNLPTWLLLLLAGLAAGLVLALNTDSRVIDVGYAGVVGADRIIGGEIPYGNMPPDVGTGDTYGPLNYLLYVPFVLMFGFSGNWDFLPAAHALTMFSFVAGAMALFIAGYKLSGPKGASAMVFAWAAFPYTLYATNNNTNDVIVAAISAIALAAAASPLARGATVAAGFAVKLYPLMLGPLWISHDGWKRRPITDFVLGGLGVVLISFAILLIPGQPIEAARLFYESTLAFQGDRVSPWTIFTQVPELAFLQRPLTAFAIFLAVLVAFVPRRRTVRRLAALSAAVIIAFQLTVNYWFYAYVVWFEPFVFLSLLLATNEKSRLDGGHQEEGEADGDEGKQAPT